MAYKVKVCWDGGYEETYPDVEGIDARGGFLFMYHLNKKGATVPFRIFSAVDVNHFEVEEDLE